MLASLVAALVSAFCYGVAAVMQAIAVRSASNRPAPGNTAGAQAAGRVDPGLVVRMLHQWLFIASLGLDLIGFPAQLVPLRRLPPFAVQAVSGGILPGLSPQQVIRSPATCALAAAGIVSFLLYTAALEGGSVTVATAAVVLAETTPPAVVGVIFLGDSTLPGLTGVAVLGFILAVVCAVALARFGEAGERREAPVADSRASSPGRVLRYDT